MVGGDGIPHLVAEWFQLNLLVISKASWDLSNSTGRPVHPEGCE